MNADNQDSGTELGFSFRRLALLVCLLIASRGAIEFVSGGNRLIGIVVVILASIIGGWLVLLYEGSHSEE